MERMTLGQVVDYCIEVDNQEHGAEKPKTRRRTQEESNDFLG